MVQYSPTLPMGAAPQCKRCGRLGHLYEICVTPRRYKGYCECCGQSCVVHHKQLEREAARSFPSGQQEHIQCDGCEQFGHCRHRFITYKKRLERAVYEAKRALVEHISSLERAAATAAGTPMYAAKRPASATPTERQPVQLNPEVGDSGSSLALEGLASGS